METSSLAKAQQDLQNKLNRVKAVALNNDIARHASRKELKESVAAFEKSVGNGWANSHTYAAILNAYVRCGDLNGARQIYEHIKESPKIYLDVISCTTFMKGLCAEGDIPGALKLFADMKEAIPPVVPNIRTINTFLRGCLLTGAVNQGDAMLTRMQKEYNVKPDISTWEYVVALLCQGLKMEKAAPIIGRLRGDPSNAGAVAAMLVNLSRASALVGDKKGALKAVQGAIEALQQDERNADQPQKRVTGGKKAWKSDGDEARLRSLELYRVHRRAELSAELDLVKSFCTNLSPSRSVSAGNNVVPVNQSPLTTSSSTSSSTTPPLHRQDDVDNIPFLHRVLSFSSCIDCGRGLDNTSLVDSLVGALRVGFGFLNLNYIATRILHPTTTTSSSTNTNTVEMVTRTNVPLKLEICSGAGEWAVEQALHDPGSLWLTMELRHDRVHQTSTRSVLRGANNMLVLGGDARELLHTRFPSNALSNIFVNHPEPPQQTGREEAATSQAQHLLDMDFFLEMTRVLKPTGRLTVVTDNLWYGKLLVRQLAQYPSKIALKSVSATPTKSNLNSKSTSNHKLSKNNSTRNSSSSSNKTWRIKEQVGNWMLYEGNPGTDGGHIVHASSYFDRLWKRGSLTERYFLVLEKISPKYKQSIGTNVICHNRKSSKTFGNEISPTLIIQGESTKRLALGLVWLSSSGLGDLVQYECEVGGQSSLQLQKKTGNPHKHPTIKNA
eukprot:gene1445-2782_t